MLVVQGQNRSGIQEQLLEIDETALCSLYCEQSEIKIRYYEKYVYPLDL